MDTRGVTAPAPKLVPAGKLVGSDKPLPVCQVRPGPKPAGTPFFVENNKPP